MRPLCTCVPLRGMFISAVIAVSSSATACVGSTTTSNSSGAKVATLPGEPMWRKPSGTACPVGSSEIPDGCAVCDMRLPDTCQVPCEAGSGHACVILGSVFQFGIHTPRDYQKAFALYERGCNLGSAQGCEFLASELLRGEGCAPDEKAAMQLLEPLCRAGRPSSCAQAADVYFARAKPTDIAVALSLLEDGCRHGSAEVCVLLARQCSAPECVVEARRRACTFGDEKSCTPNPPVIKQE
jgi:hypothetical protein